MKTDHNNVFNIILGYAGKVYLQLSPGDTSEVFVSWKDVYLMFGGVAAQSYLRNTS